MSRRLLTLSSAASLVLCVATCALWVRSYARIDNLFQADYDDAGWRDRSIRSAVGRIWLRSVHEAGAAPSANPDESRFVGGGRTCWAVDDSDTDDVEEVADWNAPGGLPGVRTYTLTDVTPSVVRRTAIAVVPYAYPAAGASVLPALWLLTYRRSSQRRAAGLCPACGYDLRATPEEGGALLDRCPECGAIPAAGGRA